MESKIISLPVKFTINMCTNLYHYFQYNEIKQRFRSNWSLLEKDIQRVRSWPSAIYRFLDTLFKVFSWFIAMTVLSALAERTGYGIFYIVNYTAALALLGYFCLLTLYPMIYAANLTSSFALKFRIPVITFSFILCLTGASYITEILSVTSKKILYAQRCYFDRSEAAKLVPSCSKTEKHSRFPTLVIARAKP